MLIKTSYMRTVERKLERNLSDLTSELLPSLVDICGEQFLVALFIAAVSAELLFINGLAISLCSD